MQNCVTELPKGYRASLHIDLQKDKKTALKVNLWGVAIMVVLFLIGALIRPISLILDRDEGLSAFLLHWGVVIVSMLVYLVLHELTHAAAMKYYGSTKVRFGFTGMYAYAGSEVDYFAKKPYRVIALAPLVLWTLILTPICFLVPQDWFWPMWVLLVMHASGCIGDIWVTLRLLREPEEIYVRDTGVEMTVFSGE